MVPSSGRRLGTRAKFFLVCFGVLAMPVFGELAARVWVRLRWPAERVAQLTTHSPERGRFVSHPYLPFALNPAWPGHNDHGLRGRLVARDKPAGVRRVACIGSSTTYGLLVGDDETYPAQLEAALRASHGNWEVLNAGVPGWVSSEVLVDLQLRILALQPDVVVLLEGRNEVFPQAYDDFRADYSHYRRADFNFLVSNYAHKALFRWSHLAMLACTMNGQRFGWSERAEHPLYGGIAWHNQPAPERVAANLADPARTAPLQRNVESIAAICKSRGIQLLVCTMAFRPDKLAMDELRVAPGLGDVLGAQVARNNDVLRDVARRSGVPVVETASLGAHAELFGDDCHMVPEGYRRRARLVYEALIAVLAR